jgi:hypothetical protein
MQQILHFEIVLADPLQTALDEPLDVGWVEGQADVEDLAVVAVVITNSPYPPTPSAPLPEPWTYCSPRPISS